MQEVYSKIQNFLIAVILLSFVAVVGFGFLMDFGMAMNIDGSMGHCPFSPDGSVCTMSFQEHINLWQALFAATPQKTMAITLLLFSVCLVFAVTFFKDKILERIKFVRQQLYIKQDNYISPFNSFKGAIYRGIINPKIF